MADTIVSWVARGRSSRAVPTGLAVLILMSAAVARAQPPPEVPTSAAPHGAAGPDPASPPSSPEQPAAGTPLDTAALVAELASQKRQLEEEKKGLENAQKRGD